MLASALRRGVRGARQDVELQAAAE
jgi:hypothetical protein